MNICKSDICFIVLLVLFLILFYKIYKLENIKEGFDATSDMKAVIGQVYNADIEAIRNLSSIATQLTTGGLTIPGNLLLQSGTVIDLGSNDTTREVNAGKIGYNVFGDALSIVGKGKAGESRRINLYDSVNVFGNLTTNGSSKVGGNFTVEGKLILPNNTQLSADGDDATHWLRLQQANNPGQYKSLAAQDLWCAGTLSSGTINNEGNATINGNLQVNGVITIGTGAGAYTLMPGVDGFRIASGGANDSQRWWFKRNPGQRNV